ncbi:MAG TPA: hypothetical protein VF608_07525 [Thermoanaerobaculia bacterium]
MTETTRRNLLRYGIATDLVILATGVGMLLPATPSTLITAFTLAVALSVWKGGWQGGLTALILGEIALAAVFTFGAIPLATFLVASLIAGGIVWMLTRPRPAVDEAVEVQERPHAGVAPILEFRLEAERDARERAVRDREEAERRATEQVLRERARLEADRQRLEKELAERLELERQERAREAEETLRRELDAMRAETEKRLAAEREAARVAEAKLAEEREAARQAAEVAREREVARQAADAAREQEIERQAEIAKEREAARVAALEIAPAPEPPPVPVAATPPPTPKAKAAPAPPKQSLLSSLSSWFRPAPRPRTINVTTKRVSGNDTTARRLP